MESDVSNHQLGTDRSVPNRDGTSNDEYGTAAVPTRIHLISNAIHGGGVEDIDCCTPSFYIWTQA